MIQTNNALKFQKQQPYQTSTLLPRRERRLKSVKQRLTVTLPVDLLDRLRNAVYWTPGLTLAGFIEVAVATKLEALEAQNGEPFPSRMEQLKGGRPRQIQPSARAV